MENLKFIPTHQNKDGVVIGELKVDGALNDYFICTIEKTNAEEIIKAFDMRNKLIEVLKRLTDAHYNGKAHGANWINASELLKQAEQK